jgi:predicted transposase YbfD/YdcC
VDRHRHGRQEHRRARIARLSWRKDTRTGLWRARREVGHYVSQIRLDAASFGRAVRAHWGIENRAHHVRDRILREDDGRIRRQPSIFARLRSFALNLLRANGVTNVSEALYTNALSLDRLLAYGLPES